LLLRFNISVRGNKVISEEVSLGMMVRVLLKRGGCNSWSSFLSTGADAMIQQTKLYPDL